MKRIVTAVALALAALTGGIAPASAARAAHRCPVVTGVTNGRESLADWAADSKSTISEVLIVTYACGHGYPLRLDHYLDHGDARRVMPARIRLYTLGPIDPACVRFGPRGPWICVD